MIPARRTLISISRRSFSTTSLKLNPSRLLTNPSYILHRCTQPKPCQTHQIRQNSDSLSTLPSNIASGDWLCIQCQAHNFASRAVCFECARPMTDGRIFYIEGAWHCPSCNVSAFRMPFLQYLLIEEGEKNDHCTRCLTHKDDEYMYPLSERDISMFF